MASGQTDTMLAGSQDTLAANPGPVSAPASPPLEAVIDSIDEVPDHTNSSYVMDSSADLGADVAGPSTTFIPRQPSPPLPNVKSRQFPPDTRDATDQDDEDDEVLATLPIYLAPGLAPNLQLFQYPLHHRSLHAPSYALDRGKGITTRVKQKVGRVEVEIPIDAGPTVWRDDRARDLGFTLDVNTANGNGDSDIYGGRGDKEKKKDKKKKEVKWGDMVRLRSEPLPHVTGYYSGIISDGALHLQPVQKVMQFRTSLQYLDDVDARAREKASRKSGADADDSERKRPPPPPPVRQPGRKPEEVDNDGSGSIKDFRQKMWDVSANEEAEPWVPYMWREGDDQVVIDSIAKLQLPEGKRERLKTKMRPLDYLDRREK